MNGPPDKKLVLIRNICTYPHFFSFLSRCFNSKVPSLKSVNHEICFCFKIKPFIIQSQKKCFLQVGYCSFQLIFNFCKQERVGWGQYQSYTSQVLKTFEKKVLTKAIWADKKWPVHQVKLKC